MDKVYEDVKGYIDAIAENLGVAAEHVYELLVKQQVIEGVTIAVVLVLVLILLGTVCWQCAKRSNSNEYDIKPVDVIMILSGIAFIITLVISFFAIPDSIMRAVNPEYYAIKEIMDVFKGGQ